jgi:hypothetical protein
MHFQRIEFAVFNCHGADEAIAGAQEPRDNPAGEQLPELDSGATGAACGASGAGSQRSHCCAVQARIYVREPALWKAVSSAMT